MKYQFIISAILLLNSSAFADPPRGSQRMYQGSNFAPYNNGANNFGGQTQRTATVPDFHIDQDNSQYGNLHPPIVPVSQRNYHLQRSASSYSTPQYPQNMPKYPQILPQYPQNMPQYPQNVPPIENNDVTEIKPSIDNNRGPQVFQKWSKPLRRTKSDFGRQPTRDSNYNAQDAGYEPSVTHSAPGLLEDQNTDSDFQLDTTNNRNNGYQGIAPPPNILPPDSSNNQGGDNSKLKKWLKYGAITAGSVGALGLGAAAIWGSALNSDRPPVSPHLNPVAPPSPPYDPDSNGDSNNNPSSNYDNSNNGSQTSTGGNSGGNAVVLKDPLTGEPIQI